MFRIIITYIRIQQFRFGLIKNQVRIDSRNKNQQVRIIEAYKR